MRRLQRTVLFSIVTALLGLCLIELGSRVFFTVFRERFTFHEVGQFKLRDGDARRLRREYDRRFGWDHHYDTPLAERPRPVSYGRPLIASFGDSYTHCTGVRDDETWQTYLAALLEADVYNFGTGGFGTDQAYLKYLAVRSSLETPIVVLGLISENINRIVNVYRPFYFPKTGIRLPKPRFTLTAEGLELIENPLRSADDIPLLVDEGFIRKLGEHDYWYNRDRYPVRRFPYVRILLNRRMWREAFHGKLDRRIDDVDPRPWEDLWGDPRVSELMFAILGSFIGEVRGSGRIPIIMILPMQDEVFEKRCTGGDPESVSMVEAYCARQRCPCFNAIDALAASVGSPEEIPTLFVVHLSPRGNRIVAREFMKFIEAHAYPTLERRGGP
jgi:hypothetical protein